MEVLENNPPVKLKENKINGKDVNVEEKPTKIRKKENTTTKSGKDNPTHKVEGRVHNSTRKGRIYSSN